MRHNNLNADNSNKASKFLFNINNFDLLNKQEKEIDDIDIEPPPPTFSEDDLEASKAVAHSQGRLEGIFEEKSKREQHIAEYLQKIGEEFSNIFAAEIYRERQYEEEALKLAIEIVALLAPSLNTRLGEEALKSVLQDVLKRQSEQSEIRVDVAPDSATEIGKFIDTLWPDKDSAPRYKIVADSKMENGACQLSWKDGGMIRNPQKTAAQIKEVIEQLLVGQVMSKGNSNLTQDENNVIKEEVNSDSLDYAVSDNSDGESKND